MKFVTYTTPDGEHLGVWQEGRVYRLNRLSFLLPDRMEDLLAGGERLMTIAREAIKNAAKVQPEPLLKLLAPVPRPASCRDGYAFRKHAEAARRNRKVPMIPEFDSYPVLYFTNHQAILGPGEVPCMPDHFEQLDFELEVAAVIGKAGRNIPAEQADNHIAGFTIMNDMSARRLQMEEMQLNLGPAKGKDFATVLGPWLVTPDELAPYIVSPKPGHAGKNYGLQMSCMVNKMEVSSGNMADMDWTFAELIERASYGCNLYPGDVIGSGTVGTGCFLELNGTGLLQNPAYQPQWLQEGDVVDMHITGLGTLTNHIVAEQTDWSILNRKK